MEHHEDWRPIEGWPFAASSLGRIMRTSAFKGRGCWSKPGRVLKPRTNRLGYLYLRLSHRGHSKTFTVHKLVTSAFLGDRPPGHVVNHTNGRKDDNRIENLEYVLQVENVRHSHALHLRVHARGERHGMAKLTAADVQEIRNMAASGVARKSMADQFGVSLVMIGQIVRRKSWAHV